MATAIVPLKLKSRRLPNKNFLILGDKPLANYIFDTLLRVPEVKKIYCYTSQPSIMKILPKSIDILPRPKRLDGDDIKANELFRFAVENINDDIIVICQAPGPFISPQNISNGINSVSSGEFDCAFSAKKLQTYCWLEDKPINYDPIDMEQTQNLSPVFAETSGFYVFKKSDYLRTNSRINGNPKIISVDEKQAVDIDNPSDFSIAKIFLDFDPNKPPDFDQNPYLLGLTLDHDISNNISHISFDLDGVLIDSINVMELAWNSAKQIANVNIDFSHYKDLIGRPFFEILSLLEIPKNKWKIIQRAYEQCSEANVDKIRLISGVKSAIRKIKSAGVAVTVVTSKPKSRALSIINDLFDKDLIDHIITPEDVELGRGKPHPDQILLACIRCGEDPLRTVYVGDMEVDRLAASRAGVHFIHAGWGYGEIQVNGEVWFDNVENFAEFIIETLIDHTTHNIKVSM